MFMKHKSEAFNKFNECVNLKENEIEKSVKILQ